MTTRAERITRQRSELRARFAEGPRYCTRCKQPQPRAGGRDVPVNALHCRWECASCSR